MIVSARGIFTVVLMLFALSCGASRNSDAFSQGDTGIQVDRRVNDERIVSILNNSELSDLNDLSGGEEQDLLLKLYAIPVSGSCVPEVHMTCAYEYYLAVSERDEQPRQSVFHLGTVGEIVQVEWKEKAGTDRAYIGLEIANFPKRVLERNPKLEKVTQEYLLEVRAQELKVKDRKF